MKRRISLGALGALLGTAFILGGCTTPATRIADHPEIYNRLGPSDKDLVARGEIRPGLPQGAVFLAWGAPDRKAVANVNGHSAETWVYETSTAGEYGYGYYGPFYGAYNRGFYGPYGGRFYGRGGHRFYGFGYGFGGGYYDPFDFAGSNVIRYPYKTISFQKGRVVAFQFLAPPSIF
jgi:hypothetical protein